MRIVPVLLLALTLTACDLPQAPKADAPRGPMSGRERSLIYAADGAANQRNIPAAERDYLAAIAEGSGHIEAHLGLAQLYLKNGQADKALPILEKATELQPEHAFTNYLLGKLYLEQHRYDDAAAAFDRGLTQQPDNLDLATGRGITEDMRGNHRAAQMHYLRGMKTNPNANLTKIRTNLAMSYLLSGEPKQTVDLLKNEGNKEGAPSVTRHNLALAYGLLGQHAQAKKLIQGEMDEATRQLTIARMKDYVDQRGDGKALSLKTDLGAEEPDEKPAPKSPAKKPVKPVEKPAAEKPAAAPVEKLAPAKSSASEKPAAAPVTAKPSAKTESSKPATEAFKKPAPAE